MNKPTNSKNNCTVYISNLSYERDRNGLKSMFSKFGIIKNIKIVVEPSTNQSRGMAFIEMGSPSEAAKAIENLNAKVFDGRTVKVTWAIPMRETSVSRASATEKKVAKKDKDLDYTSIQLAKKARNDAKRKANPIVYKLKPKTIKPKNSK